MAELGKMLMIVGGTIFLFGFILWSRLGAGWLGRLPGDIRIERGSWGFYFPVVTCILLSLLISLLLNLFRR